MYAVAAGARWQSFPSSGGMGITVGGRDDEVTMGDVTVAGKVSCWTAQKGPLGLVNRSAETAPPVANSSCGASLADSL